MANISKTKEKFLLGMIITYVIAFTSLYYQIRGLYSDDGLLPARNIIRYQVALKVDTVDKFIEKFLQKPTLLWLAPQLGLSVSYSVELLCLSGVALSILSLMFRRLRHGVTFTLLYLLYLSIYQVGQTFLSFQWDILLLECGFLTILVSPWWMTSPHRGGSGGKKQAVYDPVTFWLIKWMLFRLMFASGVVKLTSQCPTWWGLTALDWHYESQCLPTPLAWYAHQLPQWFNKLSVAAVFLIEIILPYLFFAPIRNLRLFAAYSQVFLMFTIMLTGNYNFFNFLTCVLCLSCMDDQHMAWWTRERYVDTDIQLVKKKRWWVKLIKWACSIITYSALSYLFCKYFAISIDWQKKRVNSSVAFTPRQFDAWLDKVVAPTVILGLFSLVLEIGKAFIRCLVQINGGVLVRVWAMLKTALISILVISAFSLSTVTLATLSSKGVGSNYITRYGRALYGSSQQFHVANSYGLFRRMTGVGGRPELVLEGTASDNMNDGSSYKEYHFHYKPGNLSESPRVTWGHQPRLDWQMWFAALASYHHNPWLLNLVHKLLHNEPIISEYIVHNPFPHKPPRYIKATLYKYHYTKLGQSTVGAAPHPQSHWWARDDANQYLPPVSANTDDLKAFLKRMNLLKSSWAKDTSMSRGGHWLQRALDWIHSTVTRSSTPAQAICSVLITTGIIKTVIPAWI